MSFFKKNKRLVVLGLGGLMLTCCGFGGLAFGGLNATIKSSGAYRQGLARAVKDPRVQQSLGAPVVPSWMVTGSVQTDGATSTAQLAIPLEGATRNGTLYVDAHKTTGDWEFARLEVLVEGGPPVDLL